LKARAFANAMTIRPAGVVLTSLLLAALLAVSPPVLAETQPFPAGISRISVSGAETFDLLVWYPAAAEEVPRESDSYPVPASRDAPVADGRFPVVLLSHGGGVTGSSPFVLSELSVSLARHGFVVVAPFHGKIGLRGRPSRIRPALDAVRADTRFSSHIDPARLGFLGYSLGGAVALELAGATPDFVHFEAYCEQHPDDVMSCDHSPGGGGRATAAPWWAFWVRKPPAPAPLPLKAIVLLDPFAVMFPRDRLTAVTMPVLMYRPESSELPGEENAFGLASSLPKRPEFLTIPGGHFIFIDVCPLPLRTAAPNACVDPVGVDRASIHAAIEARIAAFFKDNL
jgi:predicted dienelactone hydrolase